jgi:hypothetical protein
VSHPRLITVIAFMMFTISTTAFAQAFSIHHPVEQVFYNSCTGDLLTLSGQCHQMIHPKAVGGDNEWNCRTEGIGVPSLNRYLLAYNAFIRNDLDFAACQGSARAEGRELIISQGSLPNQNIRILAECRLSMGPTGICQMECPLPQLELQCPGSPATP